MNREMIESFVQRYLDATGSQVTEKNDGWITVQLSPEADKDLMNRSYYWGFVERTGAPPEPMRFTFIYDPESYGAKAAPPRPAPPPATQQPAAGNTPDGAPAAPGTPAATGDSILGRYFGTTTVLSSGYGRIPSDVMAFGSRRMEQLFGVVKARGRFVRLFESPSPGVLNPYASLGFSTWLCVNYKVELICDMKRDELHSLGINMATGQIVEGFYDRVKKRPLTPQIPPTIHLQPASLSLDRAVAELENFLTAKIGAYDQTWSVEAWRRLKEEWNRIDSYYGELLRTVEPSQKTEVEEQYKAREQEIDWQYRPRIAVSVTNCGFFHLYEGIRTPIDPSR
ncbi:YqhG family protein [Paenibacillus sp. YN15]|uniref:YqhG family protein n=1 Tax=Paenibacillus sp. YN15 TaxID=1742774 RepID=UPI000DCEC150|nr:YqhG family protein [Paenibacillus sp. YN15]RAV05114.1 hypothetical protein DQG13_04355 [Paenibacillus sp. YN15]